MAGSARGARVGGAVLGGGWLALSTIPAVGADNFWVVILFYPLPLYWIARPWFMGVAVRHDRLVIRSWYRTISVGRGDITAVTVVRYSGLLATGSVGWLPLIGAIGVLKIRTVDGKSRDFPSTVGRRRTVVAQATRLRRELGIRSARAVGDIQE